MSIRISGIASNMDTDSMVKELVKASSAKKTELEKAQTKLEWTQTAWKTLNTKVYSFFNSTLGNMQYEANYVKKATTVADSTIASIVAGDNATNGSRTLAVKQLAKSGSLTGAKLSDDKSYTSTTTMATLGAVADGETANLKVSVGGTDTAISLSSTDTIDSFVTKLNKAGVAASFDTTNQRFFIDAKSSGESNDFTITGTNDAGTSALSTMGLGSGAVRVQGQDAKIDLNGAEFSSSSNTFAVNGLTITAQAVSGSTTKYYDADGNEVSKDAANVATSSTTYASTTVNTQNDVDSIYKMIKNFITGYNSIVNEFDSLYNADSSKGYAPLSDEEKEAMTDTQIESWEKKIKDSLLRRDSNLGTVTSTFKTAMLQSFTVDGEKTTLSDFGIETMSYFLAADNEKGAYHIAGDSTDSSAMGATDKLKTAIANNPNAVTSFFSQLTKNMYNKLNTLMRSSSYRSIYNIYDDKKMQSEYDDYTDEIKEQETKLTNLEDRYYSQFSAMEVAISKLNSTQSAVSSLFS